MVLRLFVTLSVFVVAVESFVSAGLKVFPSFGPLLKRHVKHDRIGHEMSDENFGKSAAFSFSLFADPQAQVGSVENLLFRVPPSGNGVFGSGTYWKNITRNSDDSAFTALVNSSSPLDSFESSSLFCSHRLFNETSNEYLYNHTGLSDELLTRQFQIEAGEDKFPASDWCDMTMKRYGMSDCNITLGTWHRKLSELLVTKQTTCALNRAHYQPIFLLPPDKLAAITLHLAVGKIIRANNSGSLVLEVAKAIGERVQFEINNMKWRPVDFDWMKQTQERRTTLRSSGAMNLKRLISSDDWSDSLKIQIGSSLLHCLMDAAEFNYSEDGLGVTNKAFIRTVALDVKRYRTYGMLSMHPSMYDMLDHQTKRKWSQSQPLRVPMLVPPVPWTNKRQEGGYLRLRSPLMRTHSRSQLVALNKANNISLVLSALNYLGSVPWTINKRVFQVMKDAWSNPLFNNYTNETEVIGKLPSPNFILHNNEARRVGGGGWDRRKSLLVSQPLAGTQNTKGNFSASKAMGSIDFANLERNSQWCDLNAKIAIADRFINDTMYFPHNLDFRGRAYPVPSSFNHLGSDLCRGILLFANGRPLGPTGFNWLKIHLANLFGHNKVSHSARVRWAEGNINKVLDSARNSLNGSRWWTKANDPFQALACCIEINNAIEASGGNDTLMANYVSHLPIHQDGSCNGLQHYAALGRDPVGGASVNLCPGETPCDVYSLVLKAVLRNISADALISPADNSTQRRLSGIHARLLDGLVTRKVIKQTVMTSVYGVTTVGARAQMQSKLQDLILHKCPNVTGEEVRAASMYLARLTLSSLTDKFRNAKSIMDWLGKCALLLANQNRVMSWVTPLGLPVSQPYRKLHKTQLITPIQRITVHVERGDSPVLKLRQRKACAPNFIHSLDSSHMLWTAVKMKELEHLLNQGDVDASTKRVNVSFASVHDSFWTCAGDVDAMNKLLRECFVGLYSEPVLYNLREALVNQHPDIQFPVLPITGTLDIEKVQDSLYFFN